jgi:hypothetical protein
MPEIATAPDTLPTTRPQLFLAGTIEMGEALAWQPEAAEKARAFGWTVLNPRRDGVALWEPTVDDPDFVEQVNWELDAQDQADRIVMNLVAGSFSPVSLLELGLYAASGKLVVICPKEFWRAGNVEIVCRRYRIPLVATIEEALNPALTTRPPRTHVTQLHPSLFRDPVKDGSFLVRGSTDAPHVPGSIADEELITGFVREDRVHITPLETPAPPPAMTLAEVRDAMATAAPRLWRDYGGQLHFQHQEAVDAMSTAVFSALCHRAKLAKGDPNRYPYTHIGSGPSLNLSPAAAMERALRAHETFVSGPAPIPEDSTSPKSAQDLETWLRQKALDQSDSDWGDSETLSLIAAADMIALHHRASQPTPSVPEETARPQTLHDLITLVFSPKDPPPASWSAPLAALRDGRVRPSVPRRRDPDETVEESLQPDAEEPVDAEETLDLALRLGVDHQHVALYPETEYDDCALCYLIDQLSDPTDATRKATAFDKIVDVLWAKDHLEQIALALDLTNEVLSKVEYVDNPDLTKRVNEFAGGTDMQDDLREIAKIIGEVASDAPPPSPIDVPVTSAAANYVSVSTICFVCGITAPGTDPEGWATWLRTNTLLPYFLHSCPEHSTHEGLWEILPLAQQSKHSLSESEAMEILKERDDAVEWANKLAYAIGGGAEGEHSNLNDPWQNALDIAATTPPATIARSVNHVAWLWKLRDNLLSPEGDEYEVEAIHENQVRVSPRWNLRRTFDGTWVISCDSDEFYFYKFATPEQAAGAAEAIDAAARAHLGAETS